MMGRSRDEDDEYRFFDANEDIASPSSSDSSFGVDNRLSSSFEYEAWTKTPQSVQERRSKFLYWMGLNSDQMVLENQGDGSGDQLKEDIDRIMKNSGAVLRTPRVGQEFPLIQSSLSSWSSDALEVSEESGSSICRIENLGGGKECSDDKLGKKGEQNKLQALPEELENTCGSSPAIQQPRQRETKVASNLRGNINRIKNRWWSKLRSMSCNVDKRGVANSLRPSNSSPMQGTRVKRIKVHHSRKRWKELSALFTGQDIQAHKGPILTMKFSLDGQFLATGGEDGVVRVWQVVEDARSNEIDIPDIDPSCIYFTVNHLSELAPIVVDREKLSKLKNPRITAHSACVIFPPRVFRILEEPLHQFHGHGGEILDLSWSKNNYLLSSSVDKTVHLWHVGCDGCVKVFPHRNFVTCVQFNPVDNNHFISGSIDGKVRIWAITSCQVVDWTDAKDIVTAACYRPDGQGVIVGTMKGTCRFYDISDANFQLDDQICLNSKKKPLCKRITGFQFFPQDPSRLMVTCADSQVRILHGINVVGKYRGLHKSGNQLFASFTPDGRHIISCEDSNVYIWNCVDPDNLSMAQPKIIRSCEWFSTNASIAVPWSGLKAENSLNGSQIRVLDGNSANIVAFPTPACFSISQDFILESFPKGSATWPEEKLLSSSPKAVTSTMHKTQYEFLRSSRQSTSSSHAWNLVIVTAGWDGRIRSFHNYGLPVGL